MTSTLPSFLILAFSIFLPASLFGCHLVTLTETAVVNNGNGTYSYTFDVCVGTEDTYGFYLSFTGANLISNTASATGPTTGNTIFASVPAISGTGDIEYGDWDNSLGTIFSGINNDCVSLTFTFDGPITDATLGGTQLSFLPPLGCAAITVPTTSCFIGTYTVSITTDDYGGESTWEFVDQFTGLTESSGGPYASNSTFTEVICLPSGCYDFVMLDAFGDGICCAEGAGSYSVLDNTSTVVASGGSFAFSETTVLPCVVLVIDLASFDVRTQDRVNIIEWDVVSQENNDYYKIERSENLQDWTLVETVGGVGTTNEEFNYLVRDIGFSQVINYYRLVQVDFDGTAEIFAPKSIDNTLFGKAIIRKTNYLGQIVDNSYSGLVIEFYSDGSFKRNYQQ
ncbi:MAG: hypothetical protein HRT58_19725 [Crocinitomicaceae bacterium]|nr:hypothetical protein [Flavobacteriales bacterium]NQZ37900.1 hypothetical protein [Crocinitomicaceae bacterium]